MEDQDYAGYPRAMHHISGHSTMTHSPEGEKDLESAGYRRAPFSGAEVAAAKVPPVPLPPPEFGKYVADVQAALKEKDAKIAALEADANYPALPRLEKRIKELEGELSDRDQVIAFLQNKLAEATKVNASRAATDYDLTPNFVRAPDPIDPVRNDPSVPKPVIQPDGSVKSEVVPDTYPVTLRNPGSGLKDEVANNASDVAALEARGYTHFVKP